MKVSEHWLREWVNPSLTAAQIAEQLTMTGLEVEDVSPVAEKFSKIVIGKVLRTEKHPAADRLTLCLVDAGKGRQLTIVCGADNVREQMKVAVALEGGELPNGFIVKKNEIRDVVSYGMLCSPRELGLSDDGLGLYELPADAPIGADLWKYLMLSDKIFDISITPNRGDCLSVLGLSKEISAITKTKITAVKHRATPVKRRSKAIAVEIKIPNECPRYAGRIIRNVKADAITPIWMQERLRRSDIRCISPIVDIMNYVMLELGQPMHAFDLDKIDREIMVRHAKKDEKLLLLDGNTATLNKDTMVIADTKKPLAIAGVMGGMDSGVTLLTKDVFLESAYFNPLSIAKAVRCYGLNSDSSYRFERGIDPEIQLAALERATQLILAISGGEPEAIIEVISKKELPKSAILTLNKNKIDKLLGMTLAAKDIESILKRLEFQIKKTKSGWTVTVPARRSDIKLDVDLIEEIIRLHGYQKIPLHLSSVKLQPFVVSETKNSVRRIRHVLSDLGYQEIISYSFVNAQQQKLFDPEITPKTLINPISSEMSVMRTSLWPGLIDTLIYNQNRQQSRARLFETGLRFLTHDRKLTQESVISGLINGKEFPEQWGVPAREVDFFDLKGDLQTLIKLTSATDEFSFRPGSHPALHPGQTAQIYRKEQKIGLIGALHPDLLQKMDIQGNVYLFEIQLEPLLSVKIPVAKEISKFPEIRRDIAILIDSTIPTQVIQDTILSVGGEYLKEVTIFDVYQGKGITPGRKSVALSMMLQHSSRTLVDEEVVNIIERVISALKNKFAAELRG